MVRVLSINYTLLDRSQIKRSKIQILLVKLEVMVLILVGAFAVKRSYDTVLMPSRKMKMVSKTPFGTGELN